MKIDPNDCKVKYNESIMWAIIHDLIAHPLIALTMYKVDLLISFHNYTSQKAWNRNE